MKTQPVFDTSKILIVTERKPRCLWRLVNWWRRITGRYRYHVEIDYAKDGDYWCKAVYDTWTGITTILEVGRGKPPSN